MKIQNQNFLSIEQIQDQFLQTNSNNNLKTSDGFSFEEVLQKTSDSASEIKFSKHASQRLNDREIELSNEQLERLNEGTKKAGEKGIKDSLVLVDNLAFIVNTKSNTVITAMDQTSADENIFTNIDGAVIN